MSQAKLGDTVTVHYTGRLTSGEIFDSSKQREPLEFKLGSKSLIQGFEDAVVGMKTGEVKQINIPSDMAYGSYDKNLVSQVERSVFPNHMELQTGQRIQIGDNEQDFAIFTVTKLTDTIVELDANHPLAGKDLNFEIELVKIS